MNKQIFSFAFVLSGFFSLNVLADSLESTVPDPFQRFDASSKNIIDYTDLNSLFDAVVLDTGLSTRKKASSSHAKTGTRMMVKVNRSTVNEGNRFYFETFADNEANQRTLLKIRNRLENIPTQVPLEEFSREEQLAYWINLYNITMLEQVARIYPEHDLKDFLVGKKSVLSEKILAVAEVPLSLNDIQFTILKQNYDNNPLVIYGLFQGIIGGPSIRKTAYSGKYVYEELVENAFEFINSNRGTESKNEKTFRVSSLYARNKVFFADFDSDLSKHLLGYLEGDENGKLQAATKIKADINDWTIPDIFGSSREVGGSITHGNAALMGAISGSGTATVNTNDVATGRYSPEALKHLNELKQKQARERTGVVTIEELGEAPVDTSAADKTDGKEN